MKGNPQPATATPLEKIPVGRIKLPPGFKAEIWSHGHAAGRTMVMGSKGTMFMGTRVIGRVYAITNQGGKREAKVLLQGLTQPNGLAFRDGSLYVFAINRVFRYDNIEDKLDNPGEPVELTKAYDLPDTVHHNWKYVAFGPDGKMYVQVGANCNICEVNPGIHGQIRRYNADGTGMEIVARGVRNTVGFDWHPVTKELWFTDNGRDWAGNDGPEDELNRIAARSGGREFRLPLLPRQRHSRSGRQASRTLCRRGDAGGAHRTACGRPRHQVLYRHDVSAGLPQRGVHCAARLMEPREAVRLRRRRSREPTARKATIEPFMTGMLDEEKNEFHSRPSYVLQMADGSILVSDELHGATYRISYSGRTGKEIAATCDTS